MVQKKLLRSGAFLVFLGMLTGFWAAAAVSGVVTLPIPHLALAAHLNGFFGGLWLVIVAQSFPFLAFSECQLKKLACILVVATWANWLVTLVASFLGVNGLRYSHDPANNVIAFCLQVFVVLPSVIGSFYWYWGFRKKAPNYG